MGKVFIDYSTCWESSGVRDRQGHIADVDSPGYEISCPRLGRFKAVELRLDELRAYSHANQNSVHGYAQAFRQQQRVPTAHVESTVNQLINWRFCKKQQMTWSSAEAQCLLRVKTAGSMGN
jgi:hypothetical protein